ncbi:MAG: hypothetical protein D6710_01050 [Nitrospirae bacterium]|nr:MAG: hypothetical protein D6710_01050 [Nitrospirota bacterium]
MESREKLEKLLEHWGHHNEEHAESYLKWAEEAEAAGLKETARILKEVYQQTLNINTLFEQAKRELKKEGQ